MRVDIVERPEELAASSGSDPGPSEVVLHLAFEDRPDVPGLSVAPTPSAGAHGRISLLYGAPGERHAAIVGLGGALRLDAERLRRAAGCAARAVGREGYAAAAVDLGAAEDRLDAEACVQAWVEGWLLGSYAFNRYKKEAEPGAVSSLRLRIGGADGQTAARYAEKAQLRAESTMLARDWCNEPANVMTPERLVEEIERRFADYPDVSVRVYRGDDLAAFGMNGLLAVGQGSRHAPALVELIYAPDPTLPLTALVGKGMTFDMGGMNVKTGRDLSEARFDMGGACAVAGALDLLARGGAAARVAALIAVADNVPGSGAMLPSSIVRYPNGLTVQVGNTDAEGRLILADALLHAQRLGASEIVDIATLTGSVGQALGLRVSGVWGDAAVTEALRTCGESCGDRVWPMPLVDDDEELLRSSYADLSNIGSSAYGGACTAALFLRRFVGDGVRWAHIDMANTVQSPADRGYEAAGATGFGVRLLADYIERAFGQRPGRGADTL
ncbi:M17 family metallopeptidase [Cohnella hongkongensis]|uniref:Probable cytosol aminopeptidase n=1 Tax=Cohnella hongkongensis TaxID=178337 RepID=A0ABV9FBW6_9BACL